MRLLYRHSRDGGSAAAFHRHCDGKQNLLVLVHSEFDHVFGGFTSMDWSGNDQWKEDEKAFLFVVRSKFDENARIFERKSKSKDVYCYGSYGPTFGSGFDLCVDGDNKEISECYRASYTATGNAL